VPLALVLLAPLEMPHPIFTLMSTRRLTHHILPVAEIDSKFAAKLYRLFSAHYENVTLARFESDLEEKDFIVVLCDAETGEPCGFSTQQILRITVDGQPIRALFSGDTIIDPAYWGEQELVRGWCRVVGQLLADESDEPLYWLLISKGYRTYLYLPVFYHEFWPRYDRDTPESARITLDALANFKWPGYYQPQTGLLEFPSSLGNLKSEIAGVSGARSEDPNVQFFLKRNPNYLKGTELVCLAPISLENTKSIGRRLIQQAVREFQQQRAKMEETHYA
jgi:hypothetical protein